jgi:NADH-quinone oxidoreductase subunit N
MGLIYAEVGSMAFPVLTMKMTAGTGQRELFILVGTALVIVGAGFKLGVVPFHMWTPDVYQGAPAPVTAYIATVSKTAMVALLLRYLTTLGYLEGGAIAYILALIAGASMLAGNLLAIMQSNLKRLLAYSSIAHLGYLLVAVIVGGRTATEAIIFYVIAYSFTTIGAFGLVGYVSGGDGEAATIDNYRGLFWRRPAIATVLTFMMLSLAGIPLTAGFIGKFVLLSTGASGNAWTLVIVLVVASTIGLYYYLRVIAAMLSTSSEQSKEATLQPVTGIGTAVLTVVTVVVIYLGVQPTAVMDVIHRMLSGLFPI